MYFDIVIRRLKQFCHFDLKVSHLNSLHSWAVFLSFLFLFILSVFVMFASLFADQVILSDISLAAPFVMLAAKMRKYYFIYL